jgi:radical SAM superfamily enzyme YgiQ (UPF0313 family)
VVALIAELRRLGCRAHVAVGGVMPTLTPEHVAAHLPDVSFVCRGAGEYFVPRLARIVGDATVDRPFDDAQRAALLAIDGLVAVDRAGARVLAGNPRRSVTVDTLDGVALDLGLLERRHLERGVEIASSRGCLHKCAFCSIIGRQHYQARSADGMFALLGQYQARYRELFGDVAPANAFRLHLCDDDFACDRARACAFLERILATPFRLASLQVSITDLCRKRGHQLLPAPDPELLAAIRPECFADAGAPIPPRDFVADHRSRAWSSFLQIGVETFSDAELKRLAKGYRVAHVRAVVDALAARRIHVDAYLILSNSETTATDLVDSLEELCRLKLRHPNYFHIRFPVVPRLVSYFPSASYRRLVRQGRRDRLVLRDVARVPGHVELDYPFVDYDQPADASVRAAVAADFFADGGYYTASLERLRSLFSTRFMPGDREGERLLRRLDDAPRRLIFELLGEARRVARQGAAPARPLPDQSRLLAQASELLGPPEKWRLALSRHLSEGLARLVVIPTWQCELRCTYCYIPKQDGRVMSRATLERSADLLLSSARDDLVLQFFGGEALMEWDLVRHGIDYALARARAVHKRIHFILSSNGWSLDEERLAWLAARPVKLELSLDGDRDTQNRFRRARSTGLDSYQQGIAPRAGAILASGLTHEVIMVVHPRNVERMPDNFFHIASLGFRRIQINFALGLVWTRRQMESFADGLNRIGAELTRRRSSGVPIELVNLEAARPLPVRLNGEVTVDWDGTIYGSNAFLCETGHDEKFRMGHLDDRAHFDRYWLDLPSNEFLLEWTYPPQVMRNNLAVGAIMVSFLRWLRAQEATAQAPRSA